MNIIAIFPTGNVKLTGTTSGGVRLGGVRGGID